MFDNFDNGQIFYEYGYSSSLESADFTSPFTIPGAGSVQVSGDYSNSLSQGIAGYEFDNDSFLKGIKFVKNQQKNHVKNTGLSSVGLANDFSSKSDLNRIVFETKFGNISYSQFEDLNFFGTTTKDNNFMYSASTEFFYNLGNNMVFSIEPLVVLDSNDNHSFTTTFFLRKISKDKKTISGALLEYNKNFNTSLAFDIDSNIRVGLFIDQALGGNNFIVASYKYDIPTLKDSSASVDDLSSFEILAGKSAKTMKKWWTEIDNWNIGWQKN